MSKKAFNNIQELREVFLTEGYILLSQEYKNNRTPLGLVCPNGHYIKISYHGWNSGTRCKYCGVSNPIILGKKKCNNCGKWKSIKKFQTKENNKKYRNRLSSYCINCVNPREKREIPEELKPYIVKRYDKKDIDDHLPKKPSIKLKVKCQKCGNLYQTNAFQLYKLKRFRCSVCLGKENWEDEEKWNHMMKNRNCEEFRRKLSKSIKESHERDPTIRQRTAQFIKSYWEKIRGCKYEDIADDWELYRKRAYSLSESNYRKYKNIINPNSLPRGRDQYHLDHIFTIFHGFHNNIPIYIIADPCNLQMLNSWDNVNKDYRSEINKDELFERYFKGVY